MKRSENWRRANERVSERNSKHKQQQPEFEKSSYAADAAEKHGGGPPLCACICALNSYKMVR